MLLDPSYFGTYCLLVFLLVAVAWWPSESAALTWVLGLRVKILFVKIKAAVLTYRLLSAMARSARGTGVQTPPITWENIWPKW